MSPCHCHPAPSVPAWARSGGVDSLDKEGKKKVAANISEDERLIKSSGLILFLCFVYTILIRYTKGILLDALPRRPVISSGKSVFMSVGLCKDFLCVQRL